MAADIGPHSSTQLQVLAQQQPNPSLLMWSSRRTASREDDSWEVRAFAEDTGNIMGSTWPPRSYTCTFCRREFRSAQALGGHMNVHRRDRARLHQSALPASEPPPASTCSSPLNLPNQELVTSGAFCLLCSSSSPNTNPNPVFTSASMKASNLDFPSTLLSISPCTVNNLSTSTPTYIDLPVKTAISATTSPCGSVNVEYNDENVGDSSKNNHEPGFEDLDLELRLGQRSPLRSK